MRAKFENGGGQMKRVAVWKKRQNIWSTFWGEISSILTRHKRIVTIASALVVLASFAGKERNDANVGNLGAAAQHAEDQMHEEDDDKDVLSELSDLKAQTDELSSLLLKSKKEDDATLEVFRALLKMQHYSDIVEFYDSATVRLQEQMEYDPALDAEIKKVQNTELELFNRSYAGAAAMINKPDPVLLESWDNEWDGLISESRTDLDIEIIKARANQAGRDWLHHYLNVLIAKLFVVGWSLGLIANLAGVTATTEA
jgi:hypothetical protein